MENIVNWGLKLSGYSEISVDANGNDIYGPVKKLKGARSVNFTPNGDFVRVYADGTVVFIGKNNDGYAGTMEFTTLPEDFQKYALGEVEDANGLRYEIVEPTVNRFALLWEWVGDKSHIRHCMFNCVASRPDLSVITKGDGGTKNPQYTVINIQSRARDNDDAVKASTGAGTAAAVYNNWFSTVPSIAAVNAKMVTITVKSSGNAAIPGALVQLSNGAQGVTDSTGTIIFYLAAGSYSAAVSAAGYTAKLESIAVSSAAVTKAVTLAAA